jgi:hypothetical protein
MEKSKSESIGEVVRKMESNYINGDTQLSKYVNHSLHDTVEQIYAYIYSTFISGNTDALGREKPFFNVGTAAANIWFRATDLDRKSFKIKATNSKDWLDSFLATIRFRMWMRTSRYGVYLNKWGRTLARFGSAITKVVENSSGLHISVIPWNRIICDAVDFENNPKIEILELNEAQLRERVDTNGYDANMVDALCSAKKARETLDKRRKDNKNDYYKLYEIHGKFPLSNITGKASDDKTYTQQMHVISYVEVKSGRKSEYQDFTLFKGREKHDPYSICHLIEEDGRTLSIGAFEHLFEVQWMQNHSMKAIKDQLDLSSKIILQTADASFVGHNALNDIENGDVMIHAPNMPISPVNTQARDIVSWQNYAVSWKNLGNEINGISEAMLGANPKSGTAWRQTEAMLDESYSLFELMTENKGLYQEELIRTRVIPHIKKDFDTTDEITDILDQYDIDRIDAMYMNKLSIKNVNKMLKKRMIESETGDMMTPEEQQVLLNQEKMTVKDMLMALGNQRFFKPSEFDDKTWKEQFKNLEWDIEIDVTGEAYNTQEALATLNTALKVVVQPGFSQNKKAQAIVGKILEHTNAMSPMEYNAIPDYQEQVAAATPTEVPEMGVTEGTQ